MSSQLQLVDDEYFDETEEELGDEPMGGFKPLGFQDQLVVVFSLFKKGVVKLKPTDLRELGLRLHLGSDWYDYQMQVFQREQAESGASRKKQSGQPALSKSIISACQAAGAFHSMSERRTGVWRDPDGGLIINSDVLWRNDGTVLEHGLRGDHVYPSGQQMGYGPETCPATTAEIDRVLTAFRSYRWMSPFGAEFVLGWIGVALVASALDRRPHVLVTGKHGCGKSTLMLQVSALLGSQAVRYTGCPSLAGMCQHLQDQPACGLIVDESESDGRNPNRTQVFEAARASFSLQEGDSGLVRGSPSGEAKSYRISSPFLGGGISPGPMEPADASRWVLLELAEFSCEERDTSAPVSLEELEALGPSLARLFISRWPALRGSLESFKSAVQVRGGDPRAGDTYGTLLACYWTFVNAHVSAPK